MGEYRFRTDNKVNNYTIYDGDVALKPEDVVMRLNRIQGVSRDGEQPKHYKDVGGCSPIDCFKDGLISADEFVGFCKGNVIKYVVRAGRKEGESRLSDYSKAMDYLLLLMEMGENFIYDEEHNIYRE